MNTFLLISVIALQLADMATTHRILSRPGGRELNPVMVAVFNAVGMLPGLILVKGVFIALLVWANPHVHEWVMMYLIAFYLAVVGHNTYVIYKTR